MTFLYPVMFWLLIPLSLLLWKLPNKLQYIVHLVILLLLLVALARPIEKQELQKTNIQAKDIVIALDVSYSMRATDLMPTRYEFAKKTINALLKKNPTDNIMLIAFTSNPLLLSPPTTDHKLIYTALQSLNPKHILTKGTSLENLFKKLHTMQIKDKTLLLITDGGEEKTLDTLSGALRDTGAIVYILAIGTIQGTTIEDNEGSLLKDKQGNLIISRINPLLKHLASQTKGHYLIPSSSPEATADALHAQLQEEHIKTQTIQKMQYRYKEWYMLPLALALFLFIMLHTRGVGYLLAVFTLLGVNLEASVFDLYHLQKAYAHYENNAFSLSKKELKKIEEHSLQSTLLLANNYYKESAYKKAIKLYSSIHTTSPKIKQRIYFNIANAYAKLKAYDKAKIYYTKTLQLGPDKDASHNLSQIALLSNKKEASLGIAHPKSQSADSSKSLLQEKKEKNERKEDTPSSGSGGAGKSSTKEKQKKYSLHQDNKDTPKELHPLSSKVYELINKGYIHETQPW